MKLKNSYFFTLRENVKDEDSVSSNLLVRAGYIKKSSAGIYMMLPLGYKVLQNIMAVIRDEMNKTGAQELLMPALIPEDVYVASGRRDGFGKSMFSQRHAVRTRPDARRTLRRRRQDANPFLQGHAVCPLSVRNKVP